MAIKLAGYTRVEEQFSKLKLTADYVAIGEDLEVKTATNLFIPPSSNSKIGIILKIAPDVADIIGVQEGDRVVFSEWQGGRWAFADSEAPDGERKCLIMTSNHLLARVKD